MKRKRKKHRKSQKGGKFERELCYILSAWWLGHEEDSCFWRTDNSGARATTRRKKGMRTTGKCGDVSATHPCAEPFTRLITVEAKRGYGTGIHDLLDRPRKMKAKSNMTQFEKFLDQTITARNNANTPYWMLIIRRDNHEAIVYFPLKLYMALCVKGCFIYTKPTKPFLAMNAKRVTANGDCIPISFVAMRLDHFLANVSRKDIEKLWQKEKKLRE